MAENLDNLFENFLGGEEEEENTIQEEETTNEVEEIEEEESVEENDEGSDSGSDASDEDEVEEVEDEANEILLNADEEEEQEEENIDEQAFFDFASKKLNREIKSFDDLTPKEVEQNLSSEQLKQIDKFVRDTGRDVFDWFKMQSLDPEQMDSEQLIKRSMALKYPSLTEAQIDKRFNSKYKIDAELYDADTVEDAQISMQIDSEEAKATLSKLANGYKVPVSQSQTDAQAEQERLNQQYKEEYIRTMLKEVDEIQTFDFDVDGTTVKYKPSKEDLSNLKEANGNIENFFEQFKKADGTIDVKRLSQAVYFSKPENISKLLKASRGRFVNEGKDKIIKKQKNTKLPNVDGSSKGKTPSQQKIERDYIDVINAETGAKPRLRIKRIN